MGLSHTEERDKDTSNSNYLETLNYNDNDNDNNLIITRPLHSKVFFTLTLTSLTFTLYALFRIFRSTQIAKPLQSVQWQRMRMVGQAGVIGGLTGPLVWEGLGFDTWSLRFQSNKPDLLVEKLKSNPDNDKILFGSLNYLLGIFGRTTERI